MKGCQPRTLTPYLDRELSDDLRLEVSEHLKGCPTCSTLLDELSRASQQVRSMGRAEIARSALQPALEIFTDRAGLARDPAVTLAAASMVGSEASPSEPETPLSPTAMYEWSDPDEIHRTEESATADETEPATSQEGSADRHEALPEHPKPPPAEIRPPWMEAATGDDEDLEEAGRRAVDEAIDAAEEPAAAGALDGPTPLGSLFNRLQDEPAAGTDLPHSAMETPEPEAAGSEVASSGVELATIETPAVDALERSDPEAFWSRPATKPARRAGGLGSLGTQLRIGVLTAVVLIALAAAIIFASRSARQVSTGATRSSPTRQSTQSPRTGPSPTAAPSTAPSPPAGQAPTAGQLTEVVTTGSGGSGWQVTRVRTGSPSSGVTRIVFDLDGGGPAPDARLGRGPDGAVYLTAPGISIAPSGLSGFAGAGPITGVTQTGPSGLALRLATNGNPGFSIGYLGVPNRLVLDFK